MSFTDINGITQQIQILYINDVATRGLNFFSYASKRSEDVAQFVEKP
jgi:hypothetical protein